ncbi:MAG: PspC domain-containing protein, partial [Acidimicrobiales bacterium]
DGHIGGVCAGVAEYFDVDPVIVRIAAVVLAFSGPGLAVYVLAWIFVPEAKGPWRTGTPEASGAGKDKGAQIFGIVLLAMSAAFLWGDWWSPARRWFFPVGLMALGAWLVLRGNERRRDADEWAATAASAPSDPASGDGATSSDAGVGFAEGPPPFGSVGLDAETTSEVATADPTAAQESTTGTDASGVDLSQVPDRYRAEPWAGAYATAATGAMDPAELAARRRRRIVTPSVLGALLVWGGAAALLGVSLQTGLAVALCIVGIGFVVGAFMGGAWMLFVPAVVLAGALIVVSAIDIPLRGPIGERDWVPTSSEDVQDVYEMSLGEGTLDLRGIELAAGERLEVTASIGVGHLVVELPPGVGAEVAADVGAGETDLFGSKNSGVGVDANANEGADPETGTIVLDLQVGVGQIEVRQPSSEGRVLR